MDKNSVELILPALTSQAAILFDTERSELAGSYVQQFVCPMPRSPDIPRFQTAWANTISAHPALRASFAARPNGEYVQVIFRTVEMEWTTSKQDVFEQEVLDTWLAEDRKRAFDVKSAPLMRAHMMLHADGSCVFVWTVQHVLVDGWSADIVLENVFAEYQRLGSKKVTATSFNRYGVKEFEKVILQANSKSETGSQEYWSALLKDFETAPHLPPLNGAAGEAGRGEYEVSIDEVAWRKFKETCRLNAISVNAGLQTVWLLTLARFSGRTRCCYGLSVSGRRHGEIEGQVVGMFVTTIPVYLELVAGETFQSISRKIVVQNASSSRFPRFGLAQIKKILGVPPQDELFDTALVFEDFLQSDDTDTLRQRDRERFYGQTNFPLTVVLRNADKAIARFMWNKAFFAPSLIHAIAGEFLALLGMSSEGELTIEEMMQERGREIPTLFDSSSLSTNLIESESLAESFRRTVYKHPTRPAISEGLLSYSYQDLQTRVQKRAGRLRLASVDKGSVVALACSSRLETIISILAINWLGASYVPLDIRDPISRLEHIVKDSAATLIVSQPETKAIARQLGKTLILNPADENSVPIIPEPAPRSPDACANIMYTSGSTGIPKGVMIPERAILRLVREPNYVKLGTNEVIGQLGNLTFDASTFEVFGALLTGAKLALLDPNRSLELGGLGSEIRATGVTTLFVTTALLNATASSDPTAFGTVRQLLFGGERANASAIQTLLEETNKPSRLIHMYGPTESTVFTLFRKLDFATDILGNEVPLGTPVSETSVRVLDSFGGATPRGGIGEVVIGGLGLALGYTRENLTLEKFRPVSESDPFGAWYFTGDMVRRSDTDELYFYGRNDDQIKLNGHRVELAEVELVIESLPGIDGCVAIYDEEHRKIRAAVTSSNSLSVDSDLNKHIAGNLPKYMQVSDCIQISKIPMNNNGKKDRKYVRNLFSSAVSDINALKSSGVKPPDESTESRLASIWSDALGKQVPVDQNFFDSGADSLLLIKITNQIRNYIYDEIKVSDLFEFTTIEQLASFIEKKIRV